MYHTYEVCIEIFRSSTNIVHDEIHCYHKYNWVAGSAAVLSVLRNLRRRED